MLKLIHASKIYAKNGICALNAVNLTVQDGDYISVTGASGSGKSTLMHILGLLDSLTDGEYLLDGAAVAHLPAKQRARLRSEKIGFVFQQFRLLPGMTALENVALPLALQGVPRDERSERALAVLERVGLSDRANHRPHQLSGGQQQRVAIARAVVTEPCVILADEPTAGLDPAAADSVLELFDRLHRSGHTLVLITHDEHQRSAPQGGCILKTDAFSGEIIQHRITGALEPHRRFTLSGRRVFRLNQAESCAPRSAGDCRACGCGKKEGKPAVCP